MNAMPDAPAPLGVFALYKKDRWVAWRLESRPNKVGEPGRPTKVPYSPGTNRRAKADVPDTWGTHEAALAHDARRNRGTMGGIGIELGDLGDGTFLGGLDLDTCRDPEAGSIMPWALEVIERAATYAEVSPSGSGVKLYYLGRMEDVEAIRALIPPRPDGEPAYGFTWARPGIKDHPPAVELHIGHRYFAWTEQHLAGTPDTINPVSLDLFQWLAAEAGPALSGKPTIPPPKPTTYRAEADERREQRRLREDATRGDTGQPITTRVEALIGADRLNADGRRLRRRWEGDWSGLRDSSGSGLAFALGYALKACGFSREDTFAAIAAHPDTYAWAAGADARQFDRLFDRNSAEPTPEPGQARLAVTPTNPDRVVDGISAILAGQPHIFDRGMPVTLSRDTASGSLRIEMMPAERVITEVHRAARPFEYVLDKETGEFEEQDAELPVRFATRYLAESTESRRLRPLNGTTSAPLLKPDGTILAVQGYDPDTALWCHDVPDVAPLVPPRPSKEAAQQALLALRRTFATFCFADAETVHEAGAAVPTTDLSRNPAADESGFLHALLTAVCRASLHLAPGVMITAPSMSGAGTGKGLLARCIAAVAFGTSPSAMTAGGTPEELEKRVAAALLGGSATLLLDNVNSTSLRSDLLASAITERPCEMRVLGQSKIVRLSATILIMVTGNGLSVSEDLARRFLAIELDAHLEDPEAREFRQDVLADVTAQRRALLAACLTIWRWGRQNPAELTRGKALGSFRTWCEWVRDPLLALGCADPAERVSEAKAADTRREAVTDLFALWHEHHHDYPMKAADLHTEVRAIIDPQDRGRQFVAAALGKLAGTRVGGFSMSRQLPNGRWGQTTYAVKQVN